MPVPSFVANNWWRSVATLAGSDGVVLRRAEVQVARPEAGRSRSRGGAGRPVSPRIISATSSAAQRDMASGD